MGKLINLKNQRFGRLLVIKDIYREPSYGEVIWECICDCGTICNVRGSSLRKGKAKSCGCLHKELTHNRVFKDLTGQKFNRLTVINKAFKNTKREIVWKTQCDCGKIVFTTTNDLKSGHTGSCGCFNVDIHSIKYGEAAFNLLFLRYQQNAEKNNRVFSLTKEEFRKLVTSNCYYCNAIPSKIIKRKKMNGEFIYNGIDRFYNDQGYTSENSFPCCWECNQLKYNRNPGEFLKKIKDIYENCFSNYKHECPEWDYLLIDSTMPEYKSCICKDFPHKKTLKY